MGMDLKQLCFSLLLLLAVAACNASNDDGEIVAVADVAIASQGQRAQPFEAEFLAACPSAPNNFLPLAVRSGRLPAEPYCACVFEETMRDLSEDEKLIAAMYLLKGVGIDLRNRSEFKIIEGSAIGEAGKALDRARACRLLN